MWAAVIPGFFLEELMDAKILQFPNKGRTDSKEYITDTIKNALDNKTLGFLELIDIWLHYLKSNKKK